MGKPSKPVTEAERDLFRKAAAVDRRLDSGDKIFHRPRPPEIQRPRSAVSPPAPQRNSWSAEGPVGASTQEVGAGDRLSYCVAGVQKKVLHKLRRGRFVPEGSLDLHGKTLSQADKALEAFIAHCLASQYRCVHIIHGKGKGSRNHCPVLKSHLAQCLPAFPQVVAFCSAPECQGGTGAVLVLLKRTYVFAHALPIRAAT